LTALMASAAVVPESRDLGDLPACAAPCLNKSPRGNCGMMDYNCLCHNQEFIAGFTECIKSACGPDSLDLQKATDAQAETCNGQ